MNYSNKYIYAIRFRRLSRTLQLDLLINGTDSYSNNINNFDLPKKLKLETIYERLTKRFDAMHEDAIFNLIKPQQKIIVSCTFDANDMQSFIKEELIKK